MKDRKLQTAVSDQVETAQVRKDLVKVLVLNAVLLALLLGLFFLNKSSGQLDQFFAKVLQF
jgi:hypothetical protein